MTNHFDEVEQYAIDYPDDAEVELTANSSFQLTKDDIRYLRFLLNKLKGKDDRNIDKGWKDEFLGVTSGANPNPSHEEKKVIEGTENPSEERSKHDKKLEGHGTEQTSI